MELVRVGRLQVGLDRWNSSAGYGRRIGPLTFWSRGGKVKAFLQLRPFKCGRRNLYLRIAWGF
jgi:hypothetical protein